MTINWIADNGSEFKIKELAKLTSKNDWKLIDSLEYKKTELTNMTESGKTTINFPLKNFKPE